MNLGSGCINIQTSESPLSLIRIHVEGAFQLVLFFWEFIHDDADVELHNHEVSEHQEGNVVKTPPPGVVRFGLVVHIDRVHSEGHELGPPVGCGDYIEGHECLADVIKGENLIDPAASKVHAVPFGYNELVENVLVNDFAMEKRTFENDDAENCENKEEHQDEASDVHELSYRLYKAVQS